MVILQMLQASFDVCKSLPKVSSSLRFFSVSQAACEPSRKDLNAKLMKRRETNRRASESSSFRCQIDPEYRRHERARGLEAERRYTQNPEHREAIRSRKREAYIRHKNRNPHFYTKHRLRKWLHKHAWVRDELDWKAHKPVVSPVKVARTCASCNIEQYGGFQLWWVRMRGCRCPESSISYHLVVLYYSSHKNYADFVSWWTATQVRSVSLRLHDLLLWPRPRPSTGLAKRL